MAEGVDDFGDGDRDLDYKLDDEQEVDTTRSFQSGASSTPHRGEQIVMQTMQHEQSGLPDTSYFWWNPFSRFFHTSGWQTCHDCKGKRIYEKKVSKSKLWKIGFSNNGKPEIV